MSSFGDRVRRLRESAWLTQAELAERAGVSERTISDLERGLRSSVYPSTARALAEALGIHRGELLEFVRTARPTRRHAAVQGSITAAIPQPMTGMLGRDEELAAVRDLLRRPEVRLATILGPGGIGKTRLALELARSEDAAFGNAIHFVDLAPVDDPAHVRDAIGTALGVQPDSVDVMAAIRSRLSSGQALLVLDTFEHLARAAPIIVDLLAMCPTLTVVVTSRSPLRLRGEHQVELGPLSIDGAGAALDLFLQRARAARPQLAGADAMGFIREICVALDGVPLAIELAAARVRHTSLRDLAAQLKSPLAALVDGPLDLPARQQTMRGAIAWSYRLLDSEGLRLFRSLCVFRGGWSRSDIDAIARPKGTARRGLDPLSALVDAHLVIHELTETGESRYRMLDVIREYALEQATGARELNTLRARHARHFTEVAERAETGLRGPEQRRWYSALLVDEPNFRAALRWALEKGEGELALRLAGSLWMFWRWAGLFAEGRKWLEAAVNAGVESAPVVRLQGMWGAGWLAYHQAEYRRTAEIGREMLELVESSGFQRPAEMWVWRRNALTVVGIAALADGDAAAATSALEEANRLAERVGPGWHSATSLLNLGTALLYAGRPDDAADLLEHAVAGYESLGDRHFLARALIELGYAALVSSRRPAAESAITRAMQIAAVSQDGWALAEGLEAVATLRSEADPESASVLAGAAQAVRERISMRPHPPDRSINQRFLDRARGRLGDERHRTAIRAGRNLTASEATDLALARGAGVPSAHPPTPRT